MNRSLVAALLSGLVFPGAGQLYLKRGKRALLFGLPALAAAIVFISGVMARASAIIDQIQAGTVALDPVAIAAQLEAQDKGSMLGTISATVMIAAWILSVIDAWRLGKSIEK